MGLAVVSRHALAPNLHDDRVAILDVAGFPVQSNWWTLYPRGKRLSPVATVFLEHIEQTAKDWYEKRRMA
jgi:DNA-binding transcriptional LysR family regulator